MTCTRNYLKSIFVQQIAEPTNVTIMCGDFPTPFLEKKKMKDIIKYLSWTYTKL